MYSLLSVWLVLPLLSPALLGTTAAALPSSDELRTYELPAGGPLLLTCAGRVRQWTFQSQDNDTRPIVAYSPQLGNYTCSGSLSTDPLQCREHVAIDSENGTFVNLSAARMEDAGIYVCDRENSSSVWFSVTVYDVSTLAFRYTIRDGVVPQLIETKRAVGVYDLVKFNCSVVFSGTALPSLELVVNRIAEPQLKLPATGATDRMHVNERATIVYNTMAPSGLYALCGTRSSRLSSEVFQTIYGPRFLIELETTDVNLDGGVWLDCRADSYPSALFGWSFIDDKKQKTKDMNVTSSMLWVRSTGHYSCEARNELNGVRRTKEFFVQDVQPTKLVDSTDSSSEHSIAIFSAAGISLLIIIVILIVSCLLNIKRTMRPADSESPIVQQSRGAVPSFSSCWSVLDSLVAQVDAPPTYAEVMDELPTSANGSDKCPPKSVKLEREESLPSYNVAVIAARRPP